LIDGDSHRSSSSFCLFTDPLSYGVVPPNDKDEQRPRRSEATRRRLLHSVVIMPFIIACLEKISKESELTPLLGKYFV